MENNLIQDIALLKNLPKDWEIFPFDKVVRDFTGGNKKIPKGEFLAEGRFPVVDQGKNTIAGFFNEEAYLIKTKGPHIIFGDHTRALKYIDFPFSIGADGTKCLKVREDINIDPKFLYYFFQTLNIPDAGYSRHFKFLKRAVVPLPPFPIQTRVVNILNKADKLRQLNKELVVTYEQLGQSLFLEMFGDPKNNPKSFERKMLGEAISIQGGSQPAKKIFEHEPRKGYVRLVQIRDYKSDRFLTYIPKKSTKKFCTKDDIMIGRYGPPVFQILRGIEGAYNVALMKATPKDFLLKEYVYSLLRSDYVQNIIISNSQRTAGQTGVNLKLLNEIAISIPPLELQQKYEFQQKKIEKQKAQAQQALEHSEELFKSLLQRAFRGELVGEKEEMTV